MDFRLKLTYTSRGKNAVQADCIYNYKLPEFQNCQFNTPPMTMDDHGCFPRKLTCTLQSCWVSDGFGSCDPGSRRLSGAWSSAPPMSMPRPPRPRQPQRWQRWQVMRVMRVMRVLSRGSQRPQPMGRPVQLAWLELS